VQLDHVLPDDLLHHPVQIAVIGCGGTGSQLLPGLVTLHKTLMALGHPHGLHVAVWDADAVSPTNCIRQNFFDVDVGRNKAEIMINRLNVAHAGSGVRWTAVPRHFTGTDSPMAPSGMTRFIIGCVDTKASRAAIDQVVRASLGTTYWLDLGNAADNGQFVVGQWGREVLKSRERLPLVTELFPEIVTGEDDNAPSCSAVQSIQRQGVVTNRFAATLALAWLDEALRHGKVGYCGAFFNLKAGRVTSIPVDPDTWAKMGHTPALRTRRRAGRKLEAPK
jgi:PRTRC genetic system ThiF family protein